MYIAPNTNVKNLRDIRLDSSYRHTAYWESESGQYEYFADKSSSSDSEDSGGDSPIEPEPIS